MANVFLIGLEGKVAFDIASAVSVEHHTVRRRPHNIEIPELTHAGIVFAGGPPQAQLALLRRVRRAFPTLPFVLISEQMHMQDWLDALEAGATDYCCPPLARRMIQRVMESLVPTPREELTIMLPRGWRTAGKAAASGMAPIVLNQA